jgi:SAM-dependent methyltransferase
VTRPPREPLVRAALASGRAPRALERALRGALAGLWLGVLSDDELRALDERYYDSEGVYRTAEWNERGLFGWERALVEAHFEPGGRVLVLGCGGGREVLALLEHGFEAIGYEPHRGLAAYADELLGARGYADRVHVAPRGELPPDAPAADALVIGWGAYSLVRGHAARVRLLASARERLRGGAPLLLSCFQATRHGRELRATRAIAAALRRARGRDALELGDTLGPNLVHVFTPAELAAEVAAAGLELADHRRVGEADPSVSYAAAVTRVP